MKFKLNSLMVVLGLAACSLSAQAQQTVKIGFLGTLSGPAGALGQDQYDAFMLGVEHNGGKLGGATVQVIKEDDQLKTDLGVQLAQKLIERDKVNIITGVTFSNVMMAIHKPITATMGQAFRWVSSSAPHTKPIHRREYPLFVALRVYSQKNMLIRATSSTSLRTERLISNTALSNRKYRHIRAAHRTSSFKCL